MKPANTNKSSRECIVANRLANDVSSAGSGNVAMTAWLSDSPTAYYRPVKEGIEKTLRLIDTVAADRDADAAADSGETSGGEAA
jgi:hypothetical protein